MRKEYKIIGLLFIIVISMISIVGHRNVFLPVPAPVSIAPVLQKVEVKVSQNAHAGLQKGVAPDGSFITLVVDDVPYKTSATSTRTILAIMRALEKTTNFSFSGTEFPGMGMFVEEINHKKNGGGYYWMLYVNMLAAQKGVSQTIVNPGDIILWRYEKNRHE